MASYASQLLSSNTGELIHLLLGRFVSAARFMRCGGVGDLLHQLAVLQDVKGFLFTLPVLGADDDEVLSGPPGDPERLVRAQALVDQSFQVVPELAYADRIHLDDPVLDGVSVRS